MLTVALLYSTRAVRIVAYNRSPNNRLQPTPYTNSLFEY
jgi:hypothetical protein